MARGEGGIPGPETDADKQAESGGRGSRPVPRAGPRTRNAWVAPTFYCGGKSGEGQRDAIASHAFQRRGYIENWSGSRPPGSRLDVHGLGESSEGAGLR